MQQEPHPARSRYQVNVNQDYLCMLGTIKSHEHINLRISAKVCTHIGRKGSSAKSATAMKARMIGSDIGTVPEPAAPCGSLRSEPTATIVRMSLMTCSFSIVCLLSRANDLEEALDNV
jgi:hypothetical protein